jgi:hypothetical protein
MDRGLWITKRPGCNPGPLPSSLAVEDYLSNTSFLVCTKPFVDPFEGSLVSSR